MLSKAKCVIFGLLWIGSFHKTITESLWNAALYKPAFQSSVYRQAGPERVVDGINDFDYYGSCMRSCMEGSPWFMVDLMGGYMIEMIKLANVRKLANIQIDIFTTDPRQEGDGTTCYQDNSVGGIPFGNLTLSCDTPILGRYVKVTVNEENYLYFCELEVMVSRNAYQGVTFSEISVSLENMPAPLESLTSPSRIRCAHLCLQRSQDPCTAFQWLTNHTCVLYRVNPYLVTSDTGGTSINIADFGLQSQAADPYVC